MSITGEEHTRLRSARLFGGGEEDRVFGRPSRGCIVGRERKISPSFSSGRPNTRPSPLVEARASLRPEAPEVSRSGAEVQRGRGGGRGAPRPELRRAAL